MLVLTRKVNESIIIDGDIEVMVVQVRGNRVRLGFRAPSDVSIQRRERILESADLVHGLATSQEARTRVPIALNHARWAAQPR